MTQDDGESRLVATHAALALGREKKIPGSEVLQRLVDGQVVVPLLGPPLLEAGRITGWDPAIFGKPDGSKWLVAYTSKEHLDTFCSANPEYATYAIVDTRWIVSALARDIGIVFNPQTDDVLQWSAPGLAKYRKDFLEA